MPKRDHLAPLRRAIAAAGGQAALARSLAELTHKPIRQGHVWGWLNRGQVLPAEYVIPIEQIIASKVTRHELRPDIYPRETAA